jgi:pilus assembly protein Flp/PilA
MLNLVEKYTAEAAAETEDGVVAIEYVIVAAALVVALGALWTAFGDTLSLKLQAVVNKIVA